MRADFPAGLPSIGPAPGGPDRPFWSVMIPAYNASELLAKALRSVLDQDPGMHRMQIAVVDDCSTNDEARRIVEEMAPGRVEYHRGESNVGLAGNWNAALRLSRGRWVHLLHQDDLVQPGFYERLSQADADPSVGMAFCQHAFIDEVGAWKSISLLERRGAGVLENWLGRLALSLRIQCPSAVVRRSVYEELGGFRTDLKYILDWEMWVRIAARYATWYEPTVLACYRMHEASETARLRKVGADLADFHLGMKRIAAHLPAELGDIVGRDLVTYMTNEGMNVATRLMSEGDYRGGMEQVRAVCRFNPKLRFSQTTFGHGKWALKLWLRDCRRKWAGFRNLPSGDQPQGDSNAQRSVMTAGPVECEGVNHG